MSALEAVDGLTRRVNVQGGLRLDLFRLTSANLFLGKILLAYEFCVMNFDLLDFFPLFVEHNVVPFTLVRDLVRIKEILARQR